MWYFVAEVCARIGVVERKRRGSLYGASELALPRLPCDVLSLSATADPHSAGPRVQATTFLTANMRIRAAMLVNHLWKNIPKRNS